MLYIYFGRINYETAPLEMVGNIDDWFDAYYEDSWMENEWAKRVVKEIDESELINAKTVQSPVLDVIPIDWISGGSKNLIMMNSMGVKGIVYNGNNLGDNCWPLLLELSTKKDIMIRLVYFPTFKWVPGVGVSIINDNSVVNNSSDFIDKHLQFCVYSEAEFSDVAWPIEVVIGTLQPPEIDF